MGRAGPPPGLFRSSHGFGRPMTRMSARINSDNGKGSMDLTDEKGANWRVRVLVVEDDEDLQKIMKINLEHEGFEVVQAFNGKEALNLVREVTPDVVLLDLMMPEMDGFEVCKRIKSLDSTRNIPVIIVSAKETIKDKLKCFTFQADDYMTKPYEFEELSARIYLHLNKAIELQQTRERDEFRATKVTLTQMSENLNAAHEFVVDEVNKLRSVAPKKFHKHLDAIADRAIEMLRILERAREEHDPLYESPLLEHEIAGQSADD